MAIHRDQPQPIYAQTADYLRERIRQEGLAPDALLPSESALMQALGISRATVRQAFATLENEGLIYRIPGKGTYVRGALPTASQSSRVVGFVAPFARDQLTKEMFLGAERVLAERGYHLVFSNFDGDLRQEAESVNALVNQGLCGLILFPAKNVTSDSTIAWLKKSSFPVVLIGRYLSDLETDYVVDDSQAGGYKATAHLISLGYRRIGFVTTSGLRTTSVAQRLAGYRQALADHSLPYRASWLLENLDVEANRHMDDHAILYNHLSEEQQARDKTLLLDYVRQEEAPEAIFAIHDLAALRIMRVLTGDGYRIPQDIALVGYDDLPAAVDFPVPLTTIRQPRSEVGAQGARILLARLERRTAKLQKVVLPVTLVVRESCGARLRQQAVSLTG